MRPPFGFDPERLKVPLARPCARRGIELLEASARNIDPDARTVGLDGGSIPYDFLIVATGAEMRAEEIPGLAEHALTPWTPVEVLMLDTWLRRKGARDSVETGLLPALRGGDPVRGAEGRRPRLPPHRPGQPPVDRPPRDLRGG